MSWHGRGQDQPVIDHYTAKLCIQRAQKLLSDHQDIGMTLGMR